MDSQTLKECIGKYITVNVICMQTRRYMHVAERLEEVHMAMSIQLYGSLTYINKSNCKFHIGLKDSRNLSTEDHKEV